MDTNAGPEPNVPIAGPETEKKTATTANVEIKEKNKGKRKPDNGVRRRKPWDGIYDEYFRKDFFGEDY
jgi:hypothetical protein